MPDLTNDTCCAQQGIFAEFDGGFCRVTGIYVKYLSRHLVYVFSSYHASADPSQVRQAYRFTGIE